MKKEKFNIILSQDVLRLDENKEVTKADFPKAFGKKNKNNFISSKKDEAILTITTPASKTVADAYYKLQEITNVVYSEVYKLKETIYPFSKFDDIELNGKVTIEINEDNYNELKKVNSNLPEKLKDALENCEESFDEAEDLLEELYGDVKLVAKKDKIELSNIKKNYNTRFGFTLDDATILVTFALSLLEKIDYDDEDKLIANLERVNKLYNLKNKEVFAKCKEYLDSSRNEDKLSNEEKDNLMNAYMEEGYETRYALVGREISKEKESVVIIKQAVKLGIDFNILNEDKNVVEFNLDGHKEFVIEGNKTNRDNYIFPIITDDKMISKNIMDEYGLKVPEAILLDSHTDDDDINEIAEEYNGRPLVVKPRNTNYGTGITVFDKPASKEEILKAIKYAFTFDTNVLIEEYHKGMEYRFLVVDGKCMSVSNRRAASIVGDGKSTIRSIIENINKTYWHRYVGEPIKFDVLGEDYLKTQGYTYDSVVPEGERVFIRKNSNCSSGGESVDYTDVMPEYFKKEAEKASRAFNAKICGVDILIEDTSKEDYAIVEINDNPGYSISEWPYEGNEQPVALAILKFLGLAK